MTELKELQSRYKGFIDERDWGKFHTPKNVAMSISIEAAELMEIFQWRSNADSDVIQENDEIMKSIEEELADVIIYCLSLAEHLDIDILEIVERKLDENEERFDISSATEIKRDIENFPD